jgi:Ca2+-dependent lipid-binding protein
MSITNAGHAGAIRVALTQLRGVTGQRMAKEQRRQERERQQQERIDAEKNLAARASVVLQNAVTAVTSSGRVPSSSREKESQHEDESIDGHGRRCIGSLGRWCYVDRTIGLGWHPLLRFASPHASS